jgi:hypothetical protein
VSVPRMQKILSITAEMASGEGTGRRSVAALQ